MWSWVEKAKEFFLHWGLGCFWGAGQAGRWHYGSRMKCEVYNCLFENATFLNIPSSLGKTWLNQSAASRSWVPGEQTQRPALTRREVDDTTPGMLKMHLKVEFHAKCIKCRWSTLSWTKHNLRWKYKHFETRDYGEGRRIFAIKFSIWI